MPRHFSSALCAAALLLAGAGTIALSPAAKAAIKVRIGFNFFHDRLASQGRWIHHPIWGDVWRPRPRLVGADFQPYTNGYWQYTDEYGWYWISNDPFDDVVYHYGRWLYDPESGWLWVPGYTWAPAWVVWREGDDYIGWAPLPPDEAFVSGAGLSFGVDLGPVAVNFYDRWYRGRVDPSRFFVFVDNKHLVERDYRRFVVPRERVKIVLGRTREVTKFEVSNGRVVNRGVDPKVVERAAGHPVARVSAKTVIKPDAVVTTVDEAKQVRERERAAHPMNEEAIRRGGGGTAGGMEGAGKAPNETNAAGAMKETPERNATGKADRNAGENGAIRGEKDNAETMPGEPAEAGKTPEKKRPASSESRMSNPSGESMTGPSPGGVGAGPGVPNARSGDEGGHDAAPVPPHRAKPIGSMGSPSSEEGVGSTGPATSPKPGRVTGGNTSGQRPPGAGGMSGPQPGSAGGPSQSGNSQTPPPKKKRKPDSSDQAEPAPH